jgi:ferrous iron transport protein A
MMAEAGNLTAMPLRLARRGVTVRVADVRGEAGVCTRLREMGFCEQAEVRVIQNTGAMVCQVCGVRVCLSRELAENILVAAA